MGWVEGVGSAFNRVLNVGLEVFKTKELAQTQAQQQALSIQAETAKAQAAAKAKQAEYMKYLYIGLALVGAALVYTMFTD